MLGDALVADLAAERESLFDPGTYLARVPCRACDPDKALTFRLALRTSPALRRPAQALLE